MNRMSVEEFHEAEKMPLIVVLDDVRDVTLKDIDAPTEEGIDQVVRF